MKKIIIIILLIAVFYTLLFSIRLLDDGEIGIVENIESGHVVSVYSGRVNYVWRGPFFWYYNIYTISGKRSLLLDVSIPIPPLGVLKSDDYAVKIPVNIVYRIKADAFYDKSLLVNHAENIDGYVRKFTRGQFERTLEEYMKPIYNPRMIENKIDDIVRITADNVREELKSLGFEIEKLNRGGAVAIPNPGIIAEGTRFLGELRVIEREYKKKLLEAKNSINREKFTNEAYYNKLRKLSVIIRQNPDILKYIYIDKISANVKVVHSREIVDIFNDSPAEKKRLPLGEIDNLR